MPKDKDLKIEQVKASTDKFCAVCGVIKHLITIGGTVYAIYIIFEGLKPFLSSDAAVIDAMARVIEKVNIGNITGYMIGSLGYVGWYLERKGKKRAIKKKGEYQKIAEGQDEYRSSSGLTESGETPGRACNG